MIGWKVIKVSCFVFAFHFGQLSFAQTEGYEAQRNMNFLMSGGMWRSYDLRFKGIEGNPLLFNDFKPGTITLNGGQQYRLDSINLDIYSNELLVKRNGTDIVVMKTKVQEFRLVAILDSLHFIKLKDKSGHESFYQLVYSDQYSLLRRPIKSISEQTNSGAYSNGRTYSRFIESEKFFLTGEDIILELRNKKELLSHFPKYKSELNLFIKKNSIGFKRQDQLVLLAKYISSLAR